MEIWAWTLAAFVTKDSMISSTRNEGGYPGSCLLVFSVFDISFLVLWFRSHSESVEDRTEVVGEPASACTESSECRRSGLCSQGRDVLSLNRLLLLGVPSSVLVVLLRTGASCLPWRWVGALDVVGSLSASEPCRFPPVTPSTPHVSPAGHSVRLPPARSHFLTQSQCCVLCFVVMSGFAWSFDDSAASL